MAEIAVALLETNHKKYVFQRRTDDAPTHPGLISFFGGHVEPGEGKLEATVRELNEETSLGLTKDDLKFLFTLKVKESGNLVHTYYAKAGNGSFEIYEGKGKEVYSLEELVNRDDVTPGTMVAIRKIIKEGLA